MTQTPPSLAPIRRLSLTRSEQRTRALDLEARIEDGLATRSRSFRCGTGLFNFDFPRAGALNVLRVDAGVPELDARALMDFTDDLQAGLPQRSVRVVEDERADQLRPAFAAAGWVVGSLSLMAPRWRPDRPVDISSIHTVELDQLAGARANSLRRAHRDLETAEQLTVANVLPVEGTELRCYAATVGHEVAAYAVVRVCGDVAKVVEMDASVRSHGQGLGRSIIWGTVEAVRSEGARLVAVEAEDDSWAKWTIRRLGFEEIGHTHRFVRPWGEDLTAPPAV